MILVGIQYSRLTLQKPVPSTIWLDCPSHNLHSIFAESRYCLVRQFRWYAASIAIISLDESFLGRILFPMIEAHLRTLASMPRVAAFLRFFPPALSQIKHTYSCSVILQSTSPWVICLSWQGSVLRHASSIEPPPPILNYLLYYVFTLFVYYDILYYIVNLVGCFWSGDVYELLQISKIAIVINIKDWFFFSE